MLLQWVVVILACLAASLFALFIADLSLNAFGRLLKRAEKVTEEPEA